MNTIRISLLMGLCAALAGCSTTVDQFRLVVGIPRTAQLGGGLTHDPNAGTVLCAAAPPVIPGSAQYVMVVPAENGFLWVDTRASGLDTVIRVKRNNSNLACNDDISRAIKQSEICDFKVYKDVRYWVVAATKAGTPANGSLNVRLELKKTSCAIQ